MEYAGYDIHEGGFTTGSPSWNEWKGLYPVTATGNMDTEQLNCPTINISLVLKEYGGIFGNSIYLSTQYTTWARVHDYVHQAFQNFFVQLVAYDSNNNVVAASNVLDFTTPKAGEYYPLSQYMSRGLYTPEGGVTREKVILGQFERQSNNDFKFTASEGTNFDLSLGQNVSYSYLRIKITKVGLGRVRRVTENWHEESVNLNEYYLHDGDSSTNRGWVSASTQYTVLQVNESSAQYPTGEQIASGAIIKKSKLLKSDFTPAEYLIGYTKVFGLYYDVHIDSKTVEIKLRNNYYDGNVVDINQDIDRGSEIRITPLSFDKKFYDLKYKEDNKSQFLEQYSDTYSKTYGQQAINTNYEFNNDRKNLLDNIPYQSAVECLEKSKYYRDLYTRRLSRPIWTIVPWEYTLWKWDTEEETYDSTSKDMPGVPTKYATYWNSMEGYDVFPKLQFRDDSNSPVDTKNVLVFFNGFKGLQNSSGGTIPMWLTDENSAMLDINDGKPCWLYTERPTDINGQRIAIKVSQLPMFGRYRTGNNNAIELSWDFGEPLELYEPTLSTNPESTIYNQYWKTYITDLYSVNTRVVTAYVRFRQPLSKENLKHFYWFDNSYWVINKIIDYNPNNAVTKIEFVKVNDPNAYTDSLNINTNDYLIVNPTSIVFNTTLTGISNIQSNLVWGAYIVYEDSSAQTFNASISTQQFDLNGGSAIITINADSALTWTISGESWMTLSATAGTGSSNVTLTIPSTSSTRSGSIVVSGSNGSSYTWTISQSVGTPSIIPSGVTQEIPEHSSGVVYTQSFQSNVPFTVSADTWLSAWTEGSTVKFFATSNNEGQTPRVGNINLRYNNITYATITATQMTESVEYYALFDNNTTSYTYTFTSGVVDTYTGVNVSSNCQYTVRANNDWLSARTTASGIEFCCLSENQTGQERSGTISVLYEGVVLAVATIKQQESVIVVDSITPSTNLVEFGYSDVSWYWRDITVDSNTTWSAQTSEGFILNTLLPTAQTGNGYVQVIPSIAYNDDTEMRGTVTFFSTGATATTTLVRHAPAVIATSSYTCDCYATSFTVYVTALTDFTVVSEDSSWLVPSISSGTSATTGFTVTVAKNTGHNYENHRSGNIEMTATYLGSTTKRECTVTQNDMNLNASIEPTVWSFRGGQATLTITTDRYWEVSGETWMTIPADSTSGYGSSTIYLSYGNTSTNRNGYIRVYDQADHDFYVELDVSQPYVTVSVAYDIEWPLGKPQFTIGSESVSIMLPTEIGINWYNIQDGASGKQPIIKYDLIGWNSDYTIEQIINSWEVESDFVVPSYTGSDIQLLSQLQLTAETFGNSNFELRTWFDSNPNESIIVNYNYSGANWNSVYEPVIGFAKYSNVTYGSRTNNVTRTSEGGAMYHYKVSGWFDIDFVLDENALNCPFNIYVTAIVGQGTNTYTFSGTITGTTPSSSSTVRVSFAIISGSTSKYCNESLKGISGVLTSKEGATSSTGCKVIFKENQ